MKHDFADHAYQEALLDLFKPGNGVPPPLLAGREQPLRELGDFLGVLTKRGSPASDAIIYGPRGNGKTVLLEMFARQARDARVAVAELRPKLVKTPEDMAGLLLHNDDDAMIGLLDQARPDSVRLGIPGIGGAGWKGLSQDEKDALRVRHLGGLLRARCNKIPLLVTLDEAHALDEDMGATLLNLSESLRKAGAPFLLVLSGTPHLRDHLGKINASFWGRSEKLGIGRLTKVATEESLVKPLAGFDIRFDKEALATVVADSQYYPYFIQVWGKALCEVLVRETRSHRITAKIVRAAHPVVDYKRKDYYQDRYNEMYDRDLLEAADVVAGFFAAGQYTQDHNTLGVSLSQTLGTDKATAREQLKQLSHLGYIWQPGGGQDCEPGIPSLMSHVQQEQARYRAALDRVDEEKNDSDGAGGGAGGPPGP